LGISPEFQEEFGDEFQAIMATFELDRFSKYWVVKSGRPEVFFEDAIFVISPSVPHQ